MNLRKRRRETKRERGLERVRKKELEVGTERDTERENVDGAKKLVREEYYKQITAALFAPMTLNFVIVPELYRDKTLPRHCRHMVLSLNGSFTKLFHYRRRNRNRAKEGERKKANGQTEMF